PQPSRFLVGHACEHPRGPGPAGQRDMDIYSQRPGRKGKRERPRAAPVAAPTVAAPSAPGGILAAQ
ncbi:MAG: hypothetical protein M5U35_16730, partial [Roseovarius sp.]|nr:hypothetical protein [Roseovarius sp.]